MEQYYNDFGSWIRKQFPFRVQKYRLMPDSHVLTVMVDSVEAAVSL